MAFPLARQVQIRRGVVRRSGYAALAGAVLVVALISCDSEPTRPRAGGPGGVRVNPLIASTPFRFALPNPDPARFSNSQATAAHPSDGRVVGWAQDIYGADFQAVVWTLDGVIY